MTVWGLFQEFEDGSAIQNSTTKIQNFLFW